MQHLCEHHCRRTSSSLEPQRWCIPPTTFIGNTKEADAKADKHNDRRILLLQCFATFVFPVFLVFGANAANAQWGATRMESGAKSKSSCTRYPRHPPTSPPLSMIAQGKAPVVVEPDPADTHNLARLMVPGNHPFLEAIGREGRARMAPRAACLGLL